MNITVKNVCMYTIVDDNICEITLNIGVVLDKAVLDEVYTYIYKRLSTRNTTLCMLEYK